MPTLKGHLAGTAIPNSPHLPHPFVVAAGRERAGRVRACPGSASEIGIARDGTSISIGGVVGLLRKLLWLAGFVVCTFLFVVLFEYGAHDVRSFAAGAKREFADLLGLLRDLAGGGD